MESAAPLIRIALYLIAGWLKGRGLPEPIADFLSSDPTTISLVTDLLAAAVAGVALLWWRLARRLGWAT